MNNMKFTFKITHKIINLITFLIKFITNFLVNLIKGSFGSLGKRLRFSITFKMTVIYALIFLVLIFSISTGILFGFRYFLINQSQNIVEKNNKIIITYIKEKSEIPNGIIDEIVKSDNINFTIFDKDKNVVFSTQKDKNLISFYKDIDSLNIITNAEGDIMILNNQVSDNNKIYYVQLSKNLIQENFYLQTLFIILLTINIISLIIIIVICSKTSKKMLSPISDMTKTVKKISVEALDTRLNISGSKDELKELAETFNAMIDRIQQSYEQQNQFVSDASHELRTPISVIQGYANLLDRWGKNDKNVLDESITAIKSESENMKNLIESLLFLARGDKHSQKVEKEEFYLNELIDEIVKETRLIDKKHKILCESNMKVSIMADRKLLKEALRVFIDNSVKFTPENGVIKLNTKLEKKYIVIIIEDTGIGIPKEDLPNIFNRFYRADKARAKNTGGNGLGLSIAKWIIGKHNGQIIVESQLEKGTKISILLSAQK
ncbi:ATP-binding protein [Clostridium sp. JNZ J1-5]